MIPIMYAPGMGCDRESRPEYDTTSCPRNKDKIQDGRVPDKREVLMCGDTHCTYDCTYSRFLFTQRRHISPKEETTCVSG